MLSNIAWLLKQIGGYLPSRYEAGIILRYYSVYRSTQNFLFFKNHRQIVNYSFPPKKKILLEFTAREKKSRPLRKLPPRNPPSQ